MKRISSQSHPSLSLLGELRALANRALCCDVLVLDARALRVWASASGDGLLVQTKGAPNLREVLKALHVSQDELLEALRNEPPPATIPPPQEAPPKDERALGPFEVVEVIEDDGGSSVFRSRNLGEGPDDSLVVVRRIRSSACTEDESIDALLSETRRAGSITHPNVAQVFDVGVEKDAYWIVMENLRGLRLGEMIRGPRVSNVSASVVAAAVGSQVAEGLHAIHEQCGDSFSYDHLSARAVMVTKDGTCKLLPLGTAAYLTRTGPQGGYNSPEQATETTPGRRSDVYSLGVLIREIASGNPPPPRTRSSASPSGLARIGAGGDVSEKLAEIIARAVSEAPEDRYEDARQLSEALGEYLADEGVASAPAIVSTWYRAVRQHAAIALDTTGAARGPTAPREAVLNHLPSNTSLDEIRRGQPVQATFASDAFGYVAWSFARLYLLVCVFEGAFEETRARVALKRSLPRVQGLMSAIAADILS